MLQFIRDNSQGWIAWLIIGLITLVFALWGVNNYLGGTHGAKAVVLKVNGYPITQGRIDTDAKRMEKMLLAQYGMLPSSLNAKTLKAEAVKNLVRETSLLQAAMSQGFYVGEGAINQLIVTLPEFQTNGKFNEALLQGFLRSRGTSLQQFSDNLADSVLRHQAQVGLAESAFVLPAEQKNRFQLANQTRDIQMLNLPVKRYLPKVKLTTDAMQAYFKKHAEEFTTPEKVSVDYLELSITDLMKKARSSDAQLKQFYQDNPQSFKTARRWHPAQISVHVAPNADDAAVKKAEEKLKLIEKALGEGKPFADVAKQYSDDVMSAKLGGVLPWVTANTFDPAFEEVLQALKPGEVSKPVRTRYGFNIIKLLGLKDSTLRPYAEVKTKIKETLARQKAEKLFAKASSDLANITYENPTSLDDAAKALNLQVQKTGLFSRNIPDKQNLKLTKNPKLLEAAFGEDVLKDGNNSAVIEVGANDLVVFRINAHQRAKLQAFQDVKAEIKIKLTRAEAVKIAASKGEAFIQKLNAGKLTLLALSKKLHEKLTQRNGIKQNGPSKNPLLIKAAFDLNANSKNEVRGLSRSNGDFTLLQLRAVHSPSMPAKAQAKFAQTLTAQFGQLDYDYYVKTATDNAKVKYY